MDITSLTQTLTQAIKTKTAIVLQRSPEIPVVKLTEAIESWEKQNKENHQYTVGFNRPCSMVTFIPQGSTHVDYYETAQTKVAASDMNALVIYETANQTSSFSYLQKSLTNIHSFTHEGSHNSYDDLRLNLKTLFAMNPSYIAASFIENRIGLSVSSFSMCEIKSLPAFIDFLVAEGLPSSNNERNHVAPDVKKIMDKQDRERNAQALLDTADKLRQQKKPKLYKGSVTLPKPPTVGHGKDIIRDYLQNPELIKVLSDGFAKVRVANISNMEDLKVFLDILSSPDHTSRNFETLLTVLFGNSYKEVPMVSRLNFLKIICGGLGTQNFPRRKNFIWHNYHIKFEDTFGKVSKLINPETDVDFSQFPEDEETSARRINYTLRKLNPSNGTSNLVVSHKNASLNFNFTEVFVLSGNAPTLLLVKNIFSRLQNNVGTIPAIYTILNSIFFEE